MMTTVWCPEIMHMHITNHVTIFRKWYRCIMWGCPRLWNFADSNKKCTCFITNTMWKVLANTIHKTTLDAYSFLVTPDSPPDATSTILILDFGTIRQDKLHINQVTNNLQRKVHKMEKSKLDADNYNHKNRSGTTRQMTRPPRINQQWVQYPCKDESVSAGTARRLH
jgi:hypothetical protein